MPSAQKQKKPAANKHPLNNKRAFQNCLIRWFSDEGKEYPWRKTTEPWAILVSEIMLQQTQVATVLGKGHYARFMALYPTPRDMAEATEQKILKAWEGLGYYRRARNLHATARSITYDHAGIFPRDYQKLLNLPGVGQYTAGAIASFAYNEKQAIVDANVARVFSRLFNFQDRTDTTAGNKQLWQWANDLVSNNNPRIYNSALMELGQTYCSLKSPDCANCPVSRFCHCSDPSPLPVKKSATQVTRLDEFAIFSRDSHGRILLQQEVAGNRREGMWHLPRRKNEETLDLPLTHQTTYSITRYHVTLRIFTSHADATKIQTNEQWYGLDDLENLPMPSPDRRVLESLLS